MVGGSQLGLCCFYKFVAEFWVVAAVRLAGAALQDEER